MLLRGTGVSASREVLSSVTLWHEGLYLSNFFYQVLSLKFLRNHYFKFVIFFFGSFLKTSLRKKILCRTILLDGFLQNFWWFFFQTFKVFPFCPLVSNPRQKMKNPYTCISCEQSELFAACCWSSLLSKQVPQEIC